jgi:hypothetical protein
MMNHGPVDVVVLAFAEARFDGSALAELERQSASGIIRALDLIILLKDEDGNCFRVAVSDLPPEQAAAVAFIETATIGLFDDEDADAIAAEGGEMAFNYRIPAPIVDDAFAALS